MSAKILHYRSTPPTVRMLRARASYALAVVTVRAWEIDLALEEWVETHPVEALLVALVAAVVMASVLRPIAQALQGAIR